MNYTQRNFASLDASRSRSSSEPASDLAECILLKLQEMGLASEDDLASAVGGDALSVRATIETLSNLKLINVTAAGRLELSDAGKTIISLNLLSVAS
jgi:Mn-dependent DtxR family transcriptional regulator